MAGMICDHLLVSPEIYDANSAGAVVDDDAPTKPRAHIPRRQTAEHVDQTAGRA